jgi:hypothetical protein
LRRSRLIHSSRLAGNPDVHGVERSLISNETWLSYTESTFVILDAEDFGGEPAAVVTLPGVCRWGFMAIGTRPDPDQAGLPA